MNYKKIYSVISPYLVSIFCCGICLIICFAIFTKLGKTSTFILFLPAVMISAWYGGIKSGLLATILSSVAIFYFFITPYQSFNNKSIVFIAQLLIYIIEGVIVSFVIDNGHRQERITFYKKRDKKNKIEIEKLEQDLLKAKEEIASRDEFLSIASHELKTPLTTVLLQIQTTLHNIRNVSLAEFSVEHLLKMLQSTQTQTKRLSKMINDLLNISLITTHKLQLELEEVDLTTLIGDIIEDFSPKFEREGIELTLYAKESILGEFDKLRMEQVIDNLLSNAIKYGDKKPVKVEIEKDGNEAIITISDKGIGIKDSDKEKIFQLFKRGVSDTDYRGLGIGLYISNQIITLHGGKIDVKSRIGSGASFIISLPINKSS